MKKSKVISRSCLPTGSPLHASAITYLLMAHFQAPEWLFGAWGVLSLLLGLVWLSVVWNTSEVPLSGYGEDKE